MTTKFNYQDRKGWIYGFFSQVLWGTGGIATKLIDKTLPSSLLVGVRHGIGALVLGLEILRAKRHVLNNLPWIHLIILGVLAAGLPDLLLVEAIRRCGAIIAIMLARLEIPLGVVFAHFLLKEKVSAKAYIAGVLSLAGVCLISFKPGQVFTIRNTFYSGIMVAVIWALSGVYAKFILNRKTDPLALTFVRLTMGSIFGFAVAAIFISHPLEALQHLSFTDWSLLIYLGVFLSGLAYLAFYRSLNILDAHVAVILLSISIAVLLLLGLAIGERVTPLQWLGIAIVALSVYLIKKPVTAD